MSILHRWPIVFVIALGFCAQHFCSPEAQASSDDGKDLIAEKADEYLSRLNKDLSFGGAVLIAKDGEIILRKGYGCADYEKEIPNTPQTRFHIGSTSKQFTAACIMILQQDGKLKTSDTLSKFFPKFPNGDEITLRALLSHTAGLRRDPEQTLVMSAHDISNETLAVMIEQEPFDKDVVAGEFSYSNCGIMLLSRVVELASGMTFEQFVTSRIFEKVGMKDSLFDHHDMPVANKAFDYDVREGKVVPVDYDYPATAEGAGMNLCSTVDDLYRWDRALYTDNILTDESREEMFTPVKRDYGYGWGIQHLHGRKCIWHNGSIGGYRALIARYVDDDACIIVLDNIGCSPIGECPTQSIFSTLDAMVFGD